ncbi:MAG: quinone-dependent dihydroorotate dehydrogenase [Alphaproteobacteria bacterium]|jgi:dihydroorotate dehydrogenase|nr:MAG: quinone-dependent dihydroorotate dehydrogenase [Alphaproteobacteria bacterium]RUA14409.1 MAG: quinone-dependent dihydroorotate dehydrogenase [Alphaproteobacteria bacterium]
MFSVLRPFLFKLDPETTHDLAIKSLKFNYLPRKMFEVEDEQILNIELLGKNFPNPIGLAAGFDKSGEVYNSLLKFGFGFIEIGTVTPLKQFGNPKPRIFRLEDDSALINRLGFNNDGIEIIKNRIKSEKKKGVVGINIGPNKNTKDQKNDFCIGLKNFFDIADYITVNISSPNTEGLRDFHDQEKLEDLLLALNKIKSENKINIPLLLKISPDIKDNQISEIADTAIINDISGIILTNTTNSNKDKLISDFKKEEGGLSGEPLQQISTNMIKKFYKQLNGKIPIIGVGGVNSGKSAYEKIIAGASLLQLYTGLVYKGPSIVKNIKKELIQILKVEGLNNIKDAIGKNL